MKALSKRLVHHAHALANEIRASAVVVYADAIQGDQELQKLLLTVDFPTILFSRSDGKPRPEGNETTTMITVPGAHTTRTGQARLALLVCLARGILRPGDRVVCLTGPDGSNRLDTALVLDLDTESELFASVGDLELNGDFSGEVFERVLWIATRLAAEGREGRPIGSIFVLGDSERVLSQSRHLVLNPFHGHEEGARNILSPSLEETIKEFASIDGAFVVRGDGVVLAAGVQLQPKWTGRPLDLPSGLGTRHAAAATITASTSAVSFAVSQSTGATTIFKAGRILTEMQRAIARRIRAPRPPKKRRSPPHVE
ncbi:MAG: DNA integrity scanning protein DisA nucleotide-binding domain protein [Deltaproteobacteria bacterium]|nr:DNA integrity scanning protein DisA nucleotide-binding domain protein [Deltaproteobacteria bacterium]